MYEIRQTITPTTKACFDLTCFAVAAKCCKLWPILSHPDLRLCSSPDWDEFAKDVADANDVWEETWDNPEEVRPSGPGGGGVLVRIINIRF